MLGCDSSHTETYASLINKNTSSLYGKAKVNWLWGQNHAQVKEKALMGEIPFVCSTIEEAIKDADFVMVNNRFGDDHFLPAKIALAAKKPVYIDKPFTNKLSEALELTAVAKENKVPLFSFSPYLFSNEFLQAKKQLKDINNLVGSIFACPADCKEIPDPRVNDIHWYGVHVSDLVVDLLGKNIKSLKTNKSKKGLWITLTHAEGLHTTLNFPFSADDFATWSLFHREQAYHFKISVDGSYYLNTLNFLLSNYDNQPLAEKMIENSCKSIAILDAIIESEITNKEVYF